MKLKFIAAAAMLAVTGVAQAAAIDRGLDATGGDFFFNIWDTNGSFTTNLQLQQSDFNAGLAAPGAYSFSLDLSADSVFTSFMATANQSELRWNLLATSNFQGTARHNSTYNGALPTSGIGGTAGRNITTTYNSFILNGLNQKLNDTVNSATFLPAEGGYAGQQFQGCTLGGQQNFSNCGGLTDELNMLTHVIPRSGATITQVTDGMLPVVVSLQGDMASGMTLQVTAVPEPETYAMLLAGLGLMGAIARRRQNKA